MFSQDLSTPPPDKIVQPTVIGNVGDTTVVGDAVNGVKPHHEFILGIVAVVSGIMLPFLGLVLAIVSIVKGHRNHRMILVILGVIALLSTAGGSYGYYLLYSGDGSKSSTPKANSLNSEELDPDGFDSLGIKN